MTDFLGTCFRLDRWVITDLPISATIGEIIHLNGNTYAVSNQWGIQTTEAAASLRSAFPDLEISFNPTGAG